MYDKIHYKWKKKKILGNYYMQNAVTKNHVWNAV